ncbi:MAG: DEAD/DEAH box helicase [Deltaproteobacteria bacterium]|nr:DEAD/DEAH box helicase [Deltaproteobacteria bacterium]
MQKILFLYDKKLSKKNNQFTVKLSNRINKNGCWVLVKPAKIYHARDLELVSRNVPDREILKMVLESEMELRKIEGRFFSPDEEFTVLRISSKYLFRFINNSKKKKVLIDDEGVIISFKVLENVLPEIKVNDNTFDLLIAGQSIQESDFLIKAVPVTYFFKDKIVQLRSNITYSFIKEIPVNEKLKNEKFKKVLKELRDDYERFKILEKPEDNIKVINNEKCIPSISFEDTLKKARLYFIYNGFPVNDDNSKEIIFAEKDKMKIHRNLTKEDEYKKILNRCGFLLREKEDSPWFLSSGSIYDVIPLLQKKGFEIRVKEAKLYLETRVKWKISTEKKNILVGWKIVSGDFELHEKELTDAYKEGRSFMKRPDGSYGLISQEIKELLGKLSENGTIIKGFIKFKRSDFSFVSDMFDELDSPETDTGFDELSDFSKDFSSINRYKIDKSLSKILRPYQTLGVNWLRTLFDLGLNGILADDMGLGKTLQVLTLLKMLKKEKKLNEPVLLIVPKTLIYNWELEIEKFTKDLSYYVYAGSKRISDTNLFKKNDIVITSYGLIRTEITLFCSMTFDYIILDEAHTIKNPYSMISKAIKKIPSVSRLSLTGTPVENTPSDLWSQFDFLMPGFLYGIKKFKDRYSVHKENLKELHVKSKPYILRRLKTEVLAELPEKTEISMYCEFSKEQKAIYDEALLRSRDAIDENTRTFSILPLILKLRQIACHPALAVTNLNKTVTSGKMENVLKSAVDIISSGHKILIFSQFTGHLKITENLFNSNEIKSFYLDGKTKKRTEVIENFKNFKEPCVFFISIKTGGVGLNLTEASYVFLLDPWWNPAVENQAIDRCYRIGQKKPVTVYRFITKDSIEEKVNELKSVKREMEQTVIDKSDIDYVPLNQMQLKDILN